MSLRWLLNSKTPNAIAARAGLIVFSLLLAGGVWYLRSIETGSIETESAARWGQIAALPNGGLLMSEDELHLGEHWENERVSRDVRLRNPTGQPVTIEKFEYPCVVAGVLPSPVVIPGNGQATVTIYMCPKRLMKFVVGETIRHQSFWITPEIQTHPGSHPGWRFDRTVRAALIAPSEIILNRVPINDNQPSAQFLVTKSANFDQLVADFDQTKLAVEIRQQTEGTYVVGVQQSQAATLRDFISTVALQAILSDGKLSTHLVDVYSDVPSRIR